jgi:hypothetical protein
MRELVENPQYIIFIDELHTLGRRRSPRVRSMLPTFLSRHFRAERFSALAPPHRESFASRLRKTVSLEARFRR